MAFQDLELLRAEIAGEFGHASEAREWFDSDGYSMRRLGKINNDDLRRLANVLRATTWAKANPERRREIARRWWKSAGGVAAKARRNAKLRVLRAEAAEKWPLIECKECGGEFRQKRAGPKPEFCSNPCWQRNRYQARTPGARRITRRAA